MKLVVAILLGGIFGIVLVKSEVISWFRIQEMFWFQGFHMYGVIGSAVVTGALSLFIIRKMQLKSLTGEEIRPRPKPFNKVGNLVGGIFFGLGWALTGACPGPLYALVGSGYATLLMAIGAALLGVLTYGALKRYLPH